METPLNITIIAQDVLDLYTDSISNVNPGFTVVADNLPGVMQYLDLVRDCIVIFDLPRLPPNDVQKAHAFDETVGQPFRYAACDNVWNKDLRETSKPSETVWDTDDDGEEIDDEVDYHREEDDDEEIDDLDNDEQDDDDQEDEAVE
jgi:hypothetical protein